MHYSLTAFFTLSLAVVSLAEPTLSPYNVHEKRSAIPIGWSYTRRHESAATLPLRIALKQTNYGKHWTAGEISRKFSPSEESVSTVRDWLVENGLASERIRVSSTKGWINVIVTVKEAERLMNTEYNVYTHVSGQEHVACEAYHLPEHISTRVDFVLPSVNFDVKLKGRSGSQPEPGRAIGQPVTELEQCDQYITPICLRALYELVYEPVATEKNSYGVVEYTPQAYLQSDLQMFAMNYSTDLLGKEPVMVSIDGGYAQTEYQGFDYNGESALDLQYGMTLGHWQAKCHSLPDWGHGRRGFFQQLPRRHRWSYCTFEGGDNYTVDAQYPDPYGGGYEGPEDCGTATPAYVISTLISLRFYTARQCAEYAKLGLMGVTILYSSGDYGVAGHGDYCLNPNGTQSSTGTIFNPTFPGTCPYVTSVGATMVKPNATVFQAQPEMACMEVIYSGGGFSNYFAMPSYQKTAVDYYLQNYPPNYPPSIWNSTGMSRALPDISANGANYVVAVDGQFELVYGTSCSSPVSGAIFTMINDARLAIGKGPIGFINPTIYSAGFAGAFNDVTEGSNPGCGTEGYNATAGWDPVTGLGTPNFPKLLENWLALP
ncbi:peptidase S8/S53 domain-containing protein [Suillus subluteus]|nr:peptidase S8/S53 domain-containing protein [Suillus subluteus]